MCPWGAQQNVEGTHKLSNLRMSYLEWNGRGSYPKPKGAGNEVVIWLKRKLFCRGPLTVAVAFSRTIQPLIVQWGGSQGKKYPNLTDPLPSDLLLVPPIGWTQLEARGKGPPGCSSCGSASWNTEQGGEGWRTDLEGTWKIQHVSQVMIFSQKTALEMTCHAVYYQYLWG